MNNQAPVNITGIGLCSALGGFQHACAAYRAGLDRFTAHEHMEVMFSGDEEASPLTICPAATNLSGYRGVGRSVKMLISAYDDLVENIQHEIPKENLEILTAMPDPDDREFDMEFTEEVTRSERLQAYNELITGPLFSRTDSGLKNAPMQMVFGDRVAFARILKKASEILTSGQAQHCLLIVADSLLSDEYLDSLLGRKLLKTDENPVGIIPGEGAAMILLSATRTGIGTNGTTPMSIDVAVEIDNSIVESTIEDSNDEDEEPNPESDPQQIKLWQGEKLLSLINSLPHAAYESQYFPQIVSDMNGRKCRATEFGFLQVGIRGSYPNAWLLEEIIPALSFGEVGTMMGPLAMAIAAASIQRGYARNREFIITLSEDSGKRAAVKMQY